MCSRGKSKDWAFSPQRHGGPQRSQEAFNRKERKGSAKVAKVAWALVVRAIGSMRWSVVDKRGRLSLHGRSTIKRFNRIVRKDCAKVAKSQMNATANELET